MKIFTLGIIAGLVLFSCQDEVKIFENPYKNGPEPLLQFKDQKPSPEQGKTGTEVTFGLKFNDTTKNFGNLKNYKFFVNQTEADILSTTDTTITIKVPVNASSGGVSLTVNDQIFFGPIFKVDGKASIAPSFEAFNGTDAEIYQIQELADGDFLLIGDFTDYENEAASHEINRLALIDYTGKYVDDKDKLNVGTGANGAIRSLVFAPGLKKYFIGGIFGIYNGNSTGMSNITRLNENFSLDTAIVNIQSLTPDDPDSKIDTVAAFNGAVSGGGTSIVKLFFDEDENEVIAVGNFDQYSSIFYATSTKDGYKTDRTIIHNLIKLHPDGSLDSSFHYDKLDDKNSPKGGNGNIKDAIQLPNGKIIVVGNFTEFDGKNVNFICRIDDADGSVDPNFNTGGSGADGTIDKITFNKNTNKILLVGDFKKYNGKDANGVVMINPDGSIASSFTFGETTEGVANYAGQLDDGKILVSGTFRKYNDIVRPGFMILNADGTLAADYNNLGGFTGHINQIIESKTSQQNPGVILIGKFSLFDNHKVGNIVKIQLDDF